MPYSFSYRFVVAALAVVVGAGFFLYEYLNEANNEEQPQLNTRPSGENEHSRRNSLQQVRECSICLEELNVNGPDVYRIVCGHIFHRRCITRWFEIESTTQESMQVTCPNCRFSL